MKDYSLSHENSKTFILNYNIEDNQIIVNFASGEKYIIPYSVDNEKRLLEEMENQVINSSYYKSKQQKKFSKSKFWAEYENIFLFFSIMMIPFSIAFAPGSTLNNLFIGSTCWFAFLSSIRIYSMISSKLKIRDIEKNKMFIENEKILKDNTKINQNVLINVSKKTQELVASTPEEKPIFTLNSIDKISYKDLKQILENIKREQRFGFDYSEYQEEKPMVLSRKRK